jgi:hypothetical protein
MGPLRRIILRERSESADGEILTWVQRIKRVRERVSDPHPNISTDLPARAVSLETIRGSARASAAAS